MHACCVDALFDNPVSVFQAVNSEKYFFWLQVTAAGLISPVCPPLRLAKMKPTGMVEICGQFFTILALVSQMFIYFFFCVCVSVFPHYEIVVVLFFFFVGQTNCKTKLPLNGKCKLFGGEHHIAKQKWSITIKYWYFSSLCPICWTRTF